ncbi:tetratricopeptide repeat protein [Rhodobacter sp. NSM]|uniref:tetratricopeptide repeat protein n=1 Tax=Rhodobacter sp. NSM TaxID=3457501 RepID=UPI003FD50DD4
MTRGLPILLLCVTLAACSGPDALSRQAAARNAPFAVDPGRDGVDGLLVGHRLLAAGEDELALRAYLRAASEQGINADVLSALGSANLHLGRLNQAEQLLRKAIEMDPSFVPAVNNLGVVLMERGRTAEAKLVFQQAFALDSGATDSIRENLRRAIAKSESTVYAEEEERHEFSLVRRGQGQYVLLSQL